MSAVPRLFVDTPLDTETVFELEEGQSKYIARVMRLGAGDGVRVFNGRHGEWHCEISEIRGKTVVLQPIEQIRPQPGDSGPHISLLFAPLKKSQTDFAVEKATELGVRAICPVITERTQTRTVRVDRLAKIAVEAAEQTERLDIPAMREPLDMHAALDALAPETPVIYCDEAAAHSREIAPMQEKLLELQGQSAALLIGPEGGFSNAEREALRARPGLHAVSLGPRILRAETAVVAALALWQANCGDWR